MRHICQLTHLSSMLSSTIQLVESPGSGFRTHFTWCNQRVSLPFLCFSHIYSHSRPLSLFLSLSLSLALSLSLSLCLIRNAHTFCFCPFIITSNGSVASTLASKAKQSYDRNAQSYWIRSSYKKAHEKKKSCCKSRDLPPQLVTMVWTGTLQAVAGFNSFV